LTQGYALTLQLRGEVLCSFWRLYQVREGSWKNCRSGRSTKNFVDSSGDALVSDRETQAELVEAEAVYLDITRLR